MIGQILSSYFFVGFVTFIVSAWEYKLSDSAVIGAFWPFFLVIKSIKVAIRMLKNE